MRFVVKGLLILGLGVCLSGCGASEPVKKQAAAPQATSGRSEKPAATSLPTDGKVVTAMSVGEGKYVASVEGLA
jgi:hypothetical protein